MIAPCMKCTDRHENCHSICDRYKDWTQKLSEWKGKVITARKPNSIMNGYRQDIITRELKHSRGKRK